MRAAADARAYRAEPDGSYLVLQRSLVFCARPSLWGFALWGTPTARDLERIVPLLALELAPDVPPHASLVDVRHLEAGDPRAFAVLTRYLRTNFDRFRSQVTRLALVRPPGLLGATVAGFYQVAGAPYAVRVFDDLPAASAWLRSPALGPVLDGAIAEASSISPVLVQLRRWLDAHLEEISLDRAAKAVSRAPRSLQRDLGAARTTFQREVDAARIRLARRLLTESDSALTEIAYDIGCASPQHFSSLFRRIVGEAPSAWRARQGRRRD
ncbi:MAG: helix-turn-helix transcriptional regulator [Deltaproteobacteria bacterium]|nr:helix-turn-helix transcriptional regulator [Deltaproteobacteria bacterium]